MLAWMAVGGTAMWAFAGLSVETLRLVRDGLAAGGTTDARSTSPALKRGVPLLAALHPGTTLEFHAPQPVKVAEPPPVAATPATTTSGLASVPIAQGVRMASQQPIERVGFLKADDPVTLIETKGNWEMVRYASGVTGWVRVGVFGPAVESGGSD